MNPLLDKFDKDFDLQWAEDDVPRLRKFAKSLAHSHLEEAYRAGVEKGKEDKARSINCGGKIKCDTKNCFLHNPPQQSNLERLIEKLGDKFEKLERITEGKPFWAGKDFWHVSIKCSDITGSDGSTPTEAVENLIKALEKK